MTRSEAVEILNDLKTRLQYAGDSYDKETDTDAIEIAIECLCARTREDNTAASLGNLCHNFYRVVNYMLGPDYYNLGADVYVTDKNTCDDIIHKYKQLVKSRDRWSMFASVLAGIMSGYILAEFVLRFI